MRQSKLQQAVDKFLSARVDERGPSNLDFTCWNYASHLSENEITADEAIVENHYLQRAKQFVDAAKRAIDEKADRRTIEELAFTGIVYLFEYVSCCHPDFKRLASEGDRILQVALGIEITSEPAGFESKTEFVNEQPTDVDKSANQQLKIDCDS
jgi:hypothetical protein